MVDLEARPCPAAPPVPPMFVALVTSVLYFRMYFPDCMSGFVIGSLLIRDTGVALILARGSCVRLFSSVAGHYPCCSQLSPLFRVLTRYIARKPDDLHVNPWIRTQTR